MARSFDRYVTFILKIISGNKISHTTLKFAQNNTMSKVKQFEVKVQLKSGTTTTTVVFGKNDSKARQLIKMQFGD